MNIRLSHEFIDESLPEKTRWFSGLPVEERIAWLDESPPISKFDSLYSKENLSEPPMRSEDPSSLFELRRNAALLRYRINTFSNRH